MQIPGYKEDYRNRHKRNDLKWRRTHKAEFNAYMNRYRKRRLRLIRKLLGNKCSCGSRKNLDIHHDTYNLERKAKSMVYFCDLKKLDIKLLCRSCHRKEHPGKWVEMGKNAERL